LEGGYIPIPLLNPILSNIFHYVNTLFKFILFISN
jgi:hypothetical protein